MIRSRKTYNNCSELPLYNFVKIVVYDRLECLYSEKKSLLLKDVDLKQLWKTISDEYNLLSNNTKSNHILSLMREVTVLSNKLSIIQNAVNFLTTDYDERLCDMLKRMGFRFSFKPETLQNDLKLTVSTAKQMVLRKQDAEKELNELNNGSKKVTEKEYNAAIAKISKHMGFKINPKETSVLDFVTYQESFYQDNKSA